MASITRFEPVNDWLRMRLRESVREEMQTQGDGERVLRRENAKGTTLAIS
ncbi:MAG: hypothetical protein KIT35_23170 [Piscinibacter sp.]|nr:hypothetical protein [Piscinibacter sp.]MCW5666745.1 hypothetical protein [Piscinibacter sp.]